ncbi:MAG: hypothetical protein NWR72_16755 [Bacteroidia bacterium]|nr:hypothetical protein [Bacteroidia bacterium]
MTKHRWYHLPSAIAAFILSGVFATTAVGFVDLRSKVEYMSIRRYIDEAHFPPMLDYFITTALVVVMGLLVFFTIQHKDPDHKLPIWIKIGLSTLFVPVVFVVLMLAFAGLIEIVSG